MSAIGYVQRQPDGSFKGAIRTLSVNAEVAIVPNRGKSGEQPDYRVVSNGVELGGGCHPQILAAFARRPVCFNPACDRTNRR